MCGKCLDIKNWKGQGLFCKGKSKRKLQLWLQCRVGPVGSRSRLQTLLLSGLRAGRTKAPPGTPLESRSERPRTPAANLFFALLSLAASDSSGRTLFIVDAYNKITPFLIAGAVLNPETTCLFPEVRWITPKISLTVLTRSLLPVESFRTTSLDEDCYKRGGVFPLEAGVPWSLV